MKCFIQLQSYREQLSLLPILQHEYEVTGEKPTLLVASDCTAVALSCDFLTPFIYPGKPDDLLGAVTLAKKLWPEVISCHPQKPVNDFPPHPNWQFDQWDRAGRLHLWNQLPLVLPRPVCAPPLVTPYILYADSEDSLLFPNKEELFKALEENFPSHSIVRLSSIRLNSLFDSLVLFDAADLIVCLDNPYLQLTRATKTPVMALVGDGWNGAARRGFKWFWRYSNWPNKIPLDLVSFIVNNRPVTGMDDSKTEALLEPNPSIVVVYIYLPNDPEHVSLANRFVTQYLKCPAGVPHRVIVVNQGGYPSPEMKAQFAKLPNLSYYNHDDSGWDIGAFIAVSRVVTEDVIACFGGTGFVQHPNWLKRMVEVWKKHGPGFYGSNSSYEITPHLSTSGFWCSPQLLAEYPTRVRTKEDRYAFEHARAGKCFWRQCEAKGVKVMLATWDGEYEWRDWRKPANIFRRGNQSNCITFFRHSLLFATATEPVKAGMSKVADELTDAAYLEATVEPPKPEVKIAVVYVYPIFGAKHDALAARFLDSYKRCPVSVSHTLYVVSNGGPPTPYMKRTLATVKHEIVVHDDTGWDIGAYRKCAKEIPCDLMVFFGGSSYVKGSGWLDRMVAAWQKHGRAIYGAMGSLGHNIHIRTTGWWAPPDLLNEYPHPTDSTSRSRYAFEHGENGLTMWAIKKGLKAFVVTWDNTYEWRQWDSIPNGFQKGNQSALLAGDRLTEPPFYKGK